MNDSRRQALENVKEQLQALQEQLLVILSEEEEARDNIPENMQESERYSKADAACDSIDTAADMLEDVVSYIEEAIGE